MVELPVEVQPFVIVDVAFPSVAKIATTSFSPFKKSLQTSLTSMHV